LVTFSSQQLVIRRVQGRFDMVTGKLTIDENVQDSHVEVVIDAGSIAADLSTREDRPHSYEFFEVAEFPSLTFKSTGGSKPASGGCSVAGDLTVEGVTLAADLVVTFCGAVAEPSGNVRVGLHASTTISRRHLEFLDHLESPHVVRDVSIEMEVEAVRSTTALAIPTLRRLAAAEGKGACNR
jgi:polyisoprenoid-binding protein YceI